MKNIKKITTIAISGIIILYFYFHSYGIEQKSADKPIGININQCSVDADCSLFEPNCCSYCNPSSAVNKNSLEKLKSEKEKRCANFNYNTCKQVECMPIADEAFCDNANHCNKRIDCKRTCELMAASSLKAEEAKKYSGCDCPSLKK